MADLDCEGDPLAQWPEDTASPIEGTYSICSPNYVPHNDLEEIERIKIEDDFGDTPTDICRKITEELVFDACLRSSKKVEKTSKTSKNIEVITLSSDEDEQDPLCLSEASSPSGRSVRKSRGVLMSETLIYLKGRRSSLKSNSSIDRRSSQAGSDDDEIPLTRRPRGRPKKITLQSDEELSRRFFLNKCNVVLNPQSVNEHIIKRSRSLTVSLDSQSVKSFIENVRIDEYSSQSVNSDEASVESLGHSIESENEELDDDHNRESKESVIVDPENVESENVDQNVESKASEIVESETKFESFSSINISVISIKDDSDVETMRQYKNHSKGSLNNLESNLVPNSVKESQLANVDKPKANEQCNMDNSLVAGRSDLKSQLHIDAPPGEVKSQSEIHTFQANDKCPRQVSQTSDQEKTTVSQSHSFKTSELNQNNKSTGLLTSQQSQVIKLNSQSEVTAFQNNRLTSPTIVQRKVTVSQSHNEVTSNETCFQTSEPNQYNKSANLQSCEQSQVVKPDPNPSAAISCSQNSYLDDQYKIAAVPSKPEQFLQNGSLQALHKLSRSLDNVCAQEMPDFQHQTQSEISNVHKSVFSSPLKDSSSQSKVASSPSFAKHVVNSSSPYHKLTTTQVPISLAQHHTRPGIPMSLAQYPTTSELQMRLAQYATTSEVPIRLAQPHTMPEVPMRLAQHHTTSDMPMRLAQHHTSPRVQDIHLAPRRNSLTDNVNPTSSTIQPQQVKLVFNNSSLQPNQSKRSFLPPSPQTKLFGSSSSGSQVNSAQGVSNICQKPLVLSSGQTIELSKAVESNSENQNRANVCQLCKNEQKTEMALDIHLVFFHYEERLKSEIRRADPSKVQPGHKCPDCGSLHVDYQAILLHYGIKHGVVKKWYQLDQKLIEEAERIDKLVSKIVQNGIPQQEEDRYELNHQIVRKLCAQDESGQNFVCQVCSYYFPSLESVENHIVSKHRQAAIDSSMLQRVAQPIQVGLASALNASQMYLPQVEVPEAQQPQATDNQADIVAPIRQRHCKLCYDESVIEGDFDIHLYNEHLSEDVKTFMSSRDPNKCPYPTCNATFTVPNDLFNHLIKLHKFLRQLYNRKVNRMQQANLKIYNCIVCINKNGAGRSDVFTSHSELKDHLVEEHFRTHIIEKALKEYAYNPNNALCPILTCGSQFNTRPELIWHFKCYHSQEYNSLFGQNDELSDDKKLYNFEVLKCLDCNFIAKTQADVYLHFYKTHRTLFIDILKGLGITRTLHPDAPDPNFVPKAKAVTKIKTEPNPTLDPIPRIKQQQPQQQQQQVVDTTTQAQPEIKTEASTPMEVITVPEVESVEVVVKAEVQREPSPDVVILGEEVRSVKDEAPSMNTNGNDANDGKPSLQLKNFRREKKPNETPTKSEAGETPSHNKENEHDNSDDEVVFVVAKYYKEKVSGKPVTPYYYNQKYPHIAKVTKPEVRLPTAMEMISIQNDIVSNNRCQLCFEEVWNVVENRERRKVLFGRHLFQKHFSVRIKMDILDSILSKRSNEDNSDYAIKACPMCGLRGDGLAVVAEHFASQHNKGLELYWERMTFNNLTDSKFIQLCHDRKAKLEKEGALNNDDERLLTFTGQSRNEALHQLKLYMKFGDLPDHTIIVQPDACYSLSRDLPPCHECSKIVEGQGNIGSVCQFEGFRKIEKMTSQFHSSSLLAFKEATFTDPEEDPTAEDRQLWTPTDTYLPSNLDEQTAKFILLYTTEEFCKLVKEENDVRSQYKGKVLWKRLQPQVREMCDVCSTSLFNFHWTCTKCGILVCIDCYRTRKKGYPLVYTARKNEENSGEVLKKPHRSRRKQRGDLDEHYWPMCKELNLHFPENFLLTQIICSDILQKLWEQVHEVKRKLNLSVTCSCDSTDKTSNDKSKDKSRPNKEISPATSQPKKTNKTKVENSIDITTLEACPVCHEELKGRRSSSFNIGLHFAKHFEKDLNAKLGNPNPNSQTFYCPICPMVNTNLTYLRIHLGIDHQEFSNQLMQLKKKQASTKNIVLKVDGEKSCKICTMNYEHHMMGKGQIRTHLYTHLQKDFIKLIPDWILAKTPDSDDESFTCAKCGYKDKQKSTFWRIHMGVFHGLLDQLYEQTEPEKKAEEETTKSPALSLEDQSQKKKMNIADYRNKEKTPTHEDASLTRTPEKSKNPLSSCQICNVWMPSSSLESHEVLHFTKDLVDIAKTQTKKPVCWICGSQSTALDEERRWNEVAIHFGLSHEGIKGLVSYQDLVLQKQEACENPNNSSPKSQSCPICDVRIPVLEFKEHLSIEHFKKELDDHAMKTGSDICFFCGIKMDNPIKLAQHYGCVHDTLNFILADKDLVKAKRNEIKDKEKDKYKKDDNRCDACQVSLQNMEPEDIIKHLAFHGWISIIKLMEKTKKIEKCPKNCKASSLSDSSTRNSPRFEDKFFDHMSHKHKEDLMREMRNAFSMSAHLKSIKLSDSKKFDKLKEKLKGYYGSIISGRWCSYCQSFCSRSDLENHFASHFEKSLSHKLSESRPKCSSCNEKFPNVRELTLHFVRKHFPSKSGCTTVEGFKKWKHEIDNLVGIKSRSSDERKRRRSESSSPHKNPRNSSEFTTSTPSTSTSSKKRQLANGTSENSAKKVRRVEKDVCQFCDDGYYPDDYTRHMATVHFRDALEKDISQEDFDSLICSLCGCSSKSREEVLLHFADYHQRLQYILHRVDNMSDTSSNASYVMSPISPENDIINETFDEVDITLGIKVYRCKVGKCRIELDQMSDMIQHAIGHVKAVVLDKLPRKSPFICPECFYEASTSVSLIKHFSLVHAMKIDNESGDCFVPALQQTCEASLDVSNRSFIRQSFPKVETERNFDVSYKPTGTAFNLFIDNLKQKFPELAANPTTSDDEDDDSSDYIKVEMPEEEKELELHPPPRIATVTTAVSKFASVPHSWLCGGRLLHLHDPTLPGNLNIFHDHWSRGQPVVVSNSSRHLDQKLWHPKAFLKDFGHLRHDLINCLSGKVIPKAPLDKFWKGFEYIKHRLVDHQGTPMLLKLKDWPPSDDIAEYMPKRFNNLFDSFPMPEYTKREGIRNLAAYLPSYCLKPELGPKMYIAYGSALYSDKASTNLHIDMSDAVNCLVYVSSPIDSNRKEDTKEVFKEVDLAGCDILMKRRVRRELPGALWHIFHPSDTVKIRDFLTKVALEKGKRLDPHDDPIHDQSSYLDGKLRQRLYQEYGVHGYAIVQCAGDTVFIPAGACHQVRNLHNCIKIAEDFVSPENISHCLHLTQEFRHLTEWHTNHEDKLQMKSILYHSVKCAITVLTQALQARE